MVVEESVKGWTHTMSVFVAKKDEKRVLSRLWLSLPKWTTGEDEKQDNWKVSAKSEQDVSQKQKHRTREQINWSVAIDVLPRVSGSGCGELRLKKFIKGGYSAAAIRHSVQVAWVGGKEYFVKTCLFVD